MEGVRDAVQAGRIDLGEARSGADKTTVPAILLVKVVERLGEARLDELAAEAEARPHEIDIRAFTRLCRYAQRGLVLIDRPTFAGDGDPRIGRLKFPDDLVPGHIR